MPADTPPTRNRQVPAELVDHLPLGVIVVGDLLALEDRPGTRKDGTLFTTVTATVLCGRAIHYVSIGSPVEARTLTGHVAPWEPEPGTTQRVAFVCAVSAFVRASGGPGVDLKTLRTN